MRVLDDRYSRNVMVCLAENDRYERLRELELIANQEICSQSGLADFQRRLYEFIEQLTVIGYFLGPWEYDSEVEYWGGKSYMDTTVEDELLLRSEFPNGIRLAWKDYDLLHKSTS